MVSLALFEIALMFNATPATHSRITIVIGKNTDLKLRLDL